MGVFVRKITKSKWKKEELLSGKPVQADAITSCLRTSQNKLSMWFDENEMDPKDAILAVLFSQQKIETISYVILLENELASKNLIFEKSDGETLIPTLKERHRDIIDLNYETLGGVSTLIAEKVTQGKVFHVTKKDFNEKIKVFYDSSQDRDSFGIDSWPDDFKKAISKSRY